MPTNQELLQASLRTRASKTSGTFNQNWMEVFNLDSIPAGAFNERLLGWINAQLSASYTSLPAAQAAYAVEQGVARWSDLTEIGSVTDLYPDYEYAFDPKNGFYKIGAFKTNTLAQFLANSAVHYSSDPSAGFSASGYTPTDAYRLFVDIVDTGGDDWTLLADGIMANPGGSTNSLKGWAALRAYQFDTEYRGLCIGQRDSVSPNNGAALGACTSATGGMSSAVNGVAADGAAHKMAVTIDAAGWAGWYEGTVFRDLRGASTSQSGVTYARLYLGFPGVTSFGTGVDRDDNFNTTWADTAAPGAIRTVLVKRSKDEVAAAAWVS